jgi:hypothetical protein
MVREAVLVQHAAWWRQPPVYWFRLGTRQGTTRGSAGRRPRAPHSSADTASWGTAIPVALGAGGRDGYAAARDGYGTRSALAVRAKGAGGGDRAPAGRSGCWGGGGPGCRQRRASPDSRRCRRWRGRPAAGRSEMAGAGGRSGVGAGRASRGLVADRRPVLLLEPRRRVPHPALPRQPRCGTGGRERIGAGRHRCGSVADMGVAEARIRPSLVVGAWPAAAGGNPGRLHMAGFYHAGRRSPYRYRMRNLVRVPRPRGPARVGCNPFTHSAVVRPATTSAASRVVLSSSHLLHVSCVSDEFGRRIGSALA